MEINTDEVDIRKRILVTSLTLEALTSVFLGGLLGIDLPNSKTLGNTSSSLSFNEKIDLLIDIGALDTKTKNKFQTFMEVRNQFMHNLNASSYEKCFSYLTGKDSFMLKNYPQAEDLSREEKLKNAVHQLSSDIIKITNGLEQKLKEKFSKQAEAEIFKKTHEAFTTSFQKSIEELNEYYDTEVKKSETFDSDRLRGIAAQIMKTIYKHWAEGINNPKK